ncbi:MAG: hypothetical protein LBQ61_00785 [Spirochaetales bacterium]|jgi:hypothetical protein|nr:hypothetical protein [Spirochaetales bacterium]
MKGKIVSILSGGIFGLLLATAPGAQTQGSPVLTTRAERLAWLSQADRETFLRNSRIYREIRPGERSLYYPGAQNSQGLEDWRRSVNPYFGVEALFFLPHHGIPADPEGQRQFALRTYNLALELNTLTGLEYYSHRRDRREVLFKRFFQIAAPGSRTAAPNIPVTVIPPVKTMLAFQEDNKFGETEYQVTFRYQEPVTAITLVNTENLYAAFIPICRAGELLFHVEIIPTREGILFYGICLTKGRGGIASVTESLQQRVFALYDWYSGKL